MNLQTPRIPVSWGELIDKLTILQIKRHKLSGAALKNVERELTQLEEIAKPALSANAEVRDLATRLHTLNEKLWEIEDHIRVKEAAGAFDEDFIELARSVYRHNDQRGRLKRQINGLLGSEFIEEKNYPHY